MRVWLFDIDGTLIASGGAGQEATFAALAEAFGVPVTRAGIGFAGRTDRAIATDVFLGPRHSQYAGELGDVSARLP